MTEPTNQPEMPPPPPSQPPSQPPGYLAPPPPPLPYAAAAPPPISPRNGLGIAALVIAIIGLMACWTVVGGVILGITAVIMGFVARSRVKRGEATNGGVAMAGIVLGALAIVAGLAFILIWYYVARELGVIDLYDCMMSAGDDQAAQDQCEDRFTRHLETKFDVTLTESP